MNLPIASRVVITRTTNLTFRNSTFCQQITWSDNKVLELNCQTTYICDLYESQNKEQLFSNTALTDSKWFVKLRPSVFTGR